MSGCAAGYFGKLPSRGDFLRQGLPASFFGPWETWLQAGLRCAVVRWPAEWKSRFLTMPVCHFHLVAGLCGPEPAFGLLVPSRDRVGRAFPLTLAWVGGDARSLEEVDRALAALHSPLAALFRAGGFPDDLDCLLASVSGALGTVAADPTAAVGDRGPGWHPREDGGGLPRIGAGQSHWWTPRYLLVAEALPSAGTTADLLCPVPLGPEHSDPERSETKPSARALTTSNSPGDGGAR